MTHYADLTRCDYFGDPELPALIAVGWLEPGFDYLTGHVEREVYERLLELSRAMWQPYTYAGVQECGLCQFDGFQCCRNIFVPGDGATYASPQAIVHYIGCHHYLPPEAFIKAVLAMPAPDSPEYFRALRANGWPSAIAQPMDEADERRLRQDTAIADARGEALVAAITAYSRANGTLPVSVDEAQRLVNQVGEWEYEVDGDRYNLYAWSDGENGSGRMLFHRSGTSRSDMNAEPFSLLDDA